MVSLRNFICAPSQAPKCPSGESSRRKPSCRIFSRSHWALFFHAILLPSWPQRKSPGRTCPRAAGPFPRGRQTLAPAAQFLQCPQDVFAQNRMRASLATSATRRLGTLAVWFGLLASACCILTKAFPQFRQDVLKLVGQLRERLLSICMHRERRREAYFSARRGSGTATPDFSSCSTAFAIARNCASCSATTEVCELASSRSMTSRHSSTSMLGSLTKRSIPLLRLQR